MSFFEKFRKGAAAARLDEERFYEDVAIELANGIQSQGLYAKALANTKGVEAAAMALYIKYRVQSMKDTIKVDGPLAENAAKELIEVLPEVERKKTPKVLPPDESFSDYPSSRGRSDHKV